MAKQNKCRFCGVEAGKYSVSYPCGSWHASNGLWSQGIACRDLCEQLRLQHEQTIEILRQRIDEAVSRAELAIQFGLTLGNGVACVFASDLDEVVKILTGNSPTISEGSE